MSRTVLVNNDYITFYIDEVHGSLYVHVNIHVWSTTVYKKCLLIWSEFLDKAASQGYTFVYAALAVQDERLHKFAELFGMFEVERNERYVLMARNTI